MTELHLAVEEGDVDKVQSCLANGADPNERDNRPVIGDGNSPLHDAASRGYVAIVELLLRAGAEVDAQCVWGYTPLIRACEFGHYEIVRRLLEAGANPNLRNRDGYSPMGRIHALDPKLMAILSRYGGVI